jgi:threonine dehydratase
MPKETIMDLPTLAGIEDAEARLRPYLAETPLIRSELLSRALGAEIWLKNETVTPISSFKMRGALIDIIRKHETDKIEKACTSSTGNHGQGVAYAARLLGLKADIFLPAEANAVKVAMVKAFGGTLHMIGKDNNEAKEAAMAFAEKTGAHFVNDGESLDLMEGTGTIGLEIARRMDHVDAMIVPIGDAPLITGAGRALKAIHPNAKVIGVQSDGAPALTESYRSGKPETRPVRTLADGLATRFPAKRAFVGLRSTADDAILVSDEEMLAAMHSLAECAHILVEPSGAAGLAAAWALRERLAGQTIVLIVTGANATVEMIRQSLDTPPLFTLEEAAGG